MPDYAVGTTFSFKFTTKKNGTATSLSGGTVVAYVGNSTTQITAGITLTADFDGEVGLNDVTVVATSGNGYTASDLMFVLTAGTLGGTNAFPMVVGEATLERESALRPTVAGRTIDVSSGGEAGIDWANVGSPTTTLNLSGTTVKTATDVETDTQDIQSKIGTPTVTLAADIADLPTNAELATALAGADDAVLAAIAALNNLSSAGAQAAAEAALAAYGAALQATLTTVAGYLDTEVAAIKAKTDNLPAAPAATGDIPTAAQVADKVLGRNMAGSSDGGRTVTSALRALRNKVVIDGSTITVYAEDDTTVAWSGTVTRADLDALQTVDPS